MEKSVWVQVPFFTQRKALQNFAVLSFYVVGTATIFAAKFRYNFVAKFKEERLVWLFLFFNDQR